MEILVECHKDIADEILQIVKTDMIKAGERFIKNIPVDIDCHIGTCWEK